jgi:uncharacterized damage-inducible protein DinB
MTHYGAKELAEGFRTVRKNTVTIAEDIPEEKYGFRATPEVMSVREMLAHLATSTSWQVDVHGQKVSSLDAAFFGARRQQVAQLEQALATTADVVEALRDEGERFTAFIEKLDEQALAEIVTFAPPVQPSRKSRFEMLLSAKEHEMHHRGQLMLIQRLIGQVPHLTRARQSRFGQPSAAPAAAR